MKINAYIEIFLLHLPDSKYYAQKLGVGLYVGLFSGQQPAAPTCTCLGAFDFPVNMYLKFTTEWVR